MGVAASFRQRATLGSYVHSSTVAARIWEDAWPAREYWQAAKFLSSQGIDPEGVPGALERLRWHPSCPIDPWRERQSWRSARSAPALLAPLEVMGPRPEVGKRPRMMVGVMAWYVADDWRHLLSLRGFDGKRRPGVKTWGAQRCSGIWLTGSDDDDATRLLVGVGLAMVWRLAQTLIGNGQRVRAVAVPTINELQGGAVRLPDGTLPLWAPQANPARPPMMLSDPGRVTIIVPSDLEGLDLKVRRTPESDPETMTLGPLDRADLCAALAAAHWRNMGARDVTCVRSNSILKGDGI